MRTYGTPVLAIAIYTAEVNAGRFQKYRPGRGANPAFMLAPTRARR